MNAMQKHIDTIQYTMKNKYVITEENTLNENCIKHGHSLFVKIKNTQILKISEIGVFLI